MTAMLAGVNVVIDAFRSDAPRHDVVRAWLLRTVADDVAIAFFEPVLSGFLRDDPRQVSARRHHSRPPSLSSKNFAPSRTP
jgi:predicted nucleic acid-binding protein